MSKQTLLEIIKIKMDNQETNPNILSKWCYKKSYYLLNKSLLNHRKENSLY